MSTTVETNPIGSHAKTRAAIAAAVILLIVLLGAAAGFTLLSSSTSGKVLTQSLAEPLNGATEAQVVIDRFSGDLSIDALTGGEALLASGALPYLDSQDLSHSASISGGQALLTLKTSSGNPSGLRLPWAGCADDTQWQIHLNPSVPADINAHSGGGNLSLNLAGLAVTKVVADTGGGLLDLVLPDGAADLNVKATSGAGNVTIAYGALKGISTLHASSGAGNVEIRLPASVAARIHVTSGMGKVTLDPQFSKIDDKTYQSPGYETAADRIEVTASSGAGNVTISTK